MGSRDISPTHIPPVSHPKWEKVCKPLEDFLKEGPKNWQNLDDWCYHTRFDPAILRNALAWLEEKGRAWSKMCFVVPADGGEAREEIFWTGRSELPNFIYEPKRSKKKRSKTNREENRTVLDNPIEEGGQPQDDQGQSKEEIHGPSPSATLFPR